MRRLIGLTKLGRRGEEVKVVTLEQTAERSMGELPRSVPIDRQRRWGRHPAGSWNVAVQVPSKREHIQTGSELFTAGWFTDSLPVSRTASEKCW